LHLGEESVGVSMAQDPWVVLCEERREYEVGSRLEDGNMRHNGAMKTKKTTI
jgi:hypothetical protein